MRAQSTPSKGSGETWVMNANGDMVAYIVFTDGVASSMVEALFFDSAP